MNGNFWVASLVAEISTVGLVISIQASITRENAIFQIAPGPILSSQIHSNSSQYDPCKVWLKKMTTFLPAVPPKFTFLCVLVTELVTDLFPLGSDPVLALPRL